MKNSIFYYDIAKNERDGIKGNYKISSGRKTRAAHKGRSRLSAVKIAALALVTCIFIAGCSDGSRSGKKIHKKSSSKQSSVISSEAESSYSKSDIYEEVTSSEAESELLSSSSNSTDTGKVYKIGVCQLVKHDALDAATEGFRDKLTELLGTENVVFYVEDAQGDSNECSTICNSFVSSNVDLIMANATPAVQAAYTATETIPVLGTSVTHYGTALDIKDWKGSTGTNVSGTSDLASLCDQAAMILELFPDKKKLGLLYCSAEVNSKYQIDTITPFLTDFGYEIREYTFSDSNDIAAAVTSACDECEVLYIPVDNTVASNTGIIDNIASAKKIPIVCGEEGICSGCGVASLSISYYDLGVKTAEMAYDILVNGADISEMEIGYAPSIKKYDKARCEELGIKVPDDYQEILR